MYIYNMICVLTRIPALASTLYTRYYYALDILVVSVAVDMKQPDITTHFRIRSTVEIGNKHIQK